MSVVVVLVTDVGNTPVKICQGHTGVNVTRDTINWIIRLSV